MKLPAHPDATQVATDEHTDREHHEPPRRDPQHIAGAGVAGEPIHQRAGAQVVLHALILLLVAAPLFAQSHADVVASVKAQLEAKHVDLSGACGAFSITRRVAWLLRDEGAGVLAKPTGNQCESKAVDIIVYKDGHGFDVLADAGGTNAPMWNAVAIENGAARWMAPTDPGDAPIPSPPTPPASVDLGPIIERLDQLQAAILELNDQHKQDNLTLLQSVGVAQTAIMALRCKASIFGTPIHCEVTR